uniref:Uncharacterized protein n=1 Tax=Nelumbo nucifera TaxID=4432 RepID=A0A822YQM4_NELNU|nr:TPA_asm: hypothetical protein HUJ06_010369 [Nelumbo nucifera]
MDGWERERQDFLEISSLFPIPPIPKLSLCSSLSVVSPT